MMKQRKMAHETQVVRAKETLNGTHKTNILFVKQTVVFKLVQKYITKIDKLVSVAE